MGDPIRERREEIESHPMSERWFREWSASACELQGFEEGTEPFSRCREEQVERALRGGVSKSVASAPMGVASSLREFGR